MQYILRLLPTTLARIRIYLLHLIAVSGSSFVWRVSHLSSIMFKTFHEIFDKIRLYTAISEMFFI